MSGNNTDEIIHKLLDSLMHRYQTVLEPFVKSKSFIFDIVSEMHYLYHKISINCGGSYIACPIWISDEKAT